MKLKMKKSNATYIARSFTAFSRFVCFSSVMNIIPLSKLSMIFFCFLIAWSTRLTCEGYRQYSYQLGGYKRKVWVRYYVTKKRARMCLLTSYELYVTAFNAYFSNTSSKLVNDFNFSKSASTTISESSLKKAASNFFIMDNIEVRAFEV